MGIERKIFHFTYKVTHLPSGRFYLGKHTTRPITNLEADKYLGSGLIIKQLLAVHPSSEFSREVLGTFDSKEAVSAAERSLITAEVLNNPLCMNLIEGGTGGTPENFYKTQTPRQVALKGASTLRRDPAKLKRRSDKLRKSALARPRELQLQAATRMRQAVSSTSRAKQGASLSASKRERMAKLLLGLQPHAAMPIRELEQLFPTYSRSSIYRALRRLKAGQSSW